MKVIKAPERYDKQPNEIACFLAGGCTSVSWRLECLNELAKLDTYNILVVYDPYNPKIESHWKQVQWEFEYLNSYINDKFVFSVYFDKYTDQPISLYELGRASVLCQPIELFSASSMEKETKIVIHKGFPMVVSLHEDYPKYRDIRCQCGLTKITSDTRTPQEHAKEIYKQALELRKNR